MDDISEFLLGRQQTTPSSYAVVLTVIVGALAIGLMIYLLRCYVQEALVRKRVKRRICQPAGGNIVPPEAMPCAKALSETKRLRKKSSVMLPALPQDDVWGRVRHVRRPRHPWKDNRFLDHSPAPH